MYRCELCKSIVSSCDLLKQHYETDHSVTSLSVIQDIQDQPVGGIKKAASVRRVVQSNGVSEKTVSDAIVVFEASDKNALSSCEEDERSYKGFRSDTAEGFLKTDADEREIVTGDATTSFIKTEQDETDFNFIFQTEHVKTSRLSYARCWLSCMHCDYRTRKHTLLTDHMLSEHDSLLALHRNSAYRSPMAPPPGQSGARTMRMSAYESTLATSKGSRRVRVHPVLESVHPCAVCGKVFRRYRYLRKHQETHRAEKRFVCTDCGKPFKSRTYLRVHRRLHDDTEATAMQKKPFSCNQCAFVSCNGAAIHAHRQIHNQGSVLCDICGHAYTDRSTLGKHKRVHDPARPYACSFPGCTWRFKTEIMCKAHVRAHTTEGKFRCTICGYVFRHKHHLQRHESRMHGDDTTQNSASATSETVRSRSIPSQTFNENLEDFIEKEAIPDALGQDLSDLGNLSSEPHGLGYDANDLSLIDNIDFFFGNGIEKS